VITLILVGINHYAKGLLHLTIMRKVYYIIATVIIFLAIITIELYVHIDRFGRYSVPQYVDTIIVLGTAVWRSGPSPALLERIALYAGRE